MVELSIAEVCTLEGGLLIEFAEVLHSLTNTQIRNLE